MFLLKFEFRIYFVIAHFSYLLVIIRWKDTVPKQTSVDRLGFIHKAYFNSLERELKAETPANLSVI